MASCRRLRARSLSSWTESSITSLDLTITSWVTLVSARYSRTLSRRMSRFFLPLSVSRQARKSHLDRSLTRASVWRCLTKVSNTNRVTMPRLMEENWARPSGQLYEVQTRPIPGLALVNLHPGGPSISGSWNSVTVDVAFFCRHLREGHPLL